MGHPAFVAGEVRSGLRGVRVRENPLRTQPSGLAAKMWDTTDVNSLSVLDDPKATGKESWYPTSREKRARYGAPVLSEGTSRARSLPAGVTFASWRADSPCELTTPC
jgi:hypothetical protein